MRPSQAVALHRDALLDITRRHGVFNVRIFGSVARGEDTDKSDVDLLVDAPRGTTYFDLVDIQDEAEKLTGVRFDVCTPQCLSERLRDKVLQAAKPL